MPAYIRLLSYFSNFILLAAFLGIGIGCLLAPARARLFAWFPVLTTAVIGGHVSGAMSYTAFAVNNKGKVRALAVAMDAGHPLLPDAPTFKELGVDWVDGAYRGIAVPKSTPEDIRKRLSDIIDEINQDAEFRQKMTEQGMELVNVTYDKMAAFLDERKKAYVASARLLGLVK